MNIVETLTDREVINTAVDLLEIYQEAIVSGEIEAVEVDMPEAELYESVGLAEVISRLRAIEEKMNQLDVENL